MEWYVNRLSSLQVYIEDFGKPWPMYSVAYSLCHYICKLKRVLYSPRILPSYSTLKALRRAGEIILCRSEPQPDRKHSRAIKRNAPTRG